MAGIEYPSSWVGICNLALARLGLDPIVSLSEGSKTASQCRQFLGAVVQEIYEQYDWQAATKRRQLAQDVEVPAFGFAHQYPLPADFARAITVDTGGQPYSIEGGSILTDGDALYLTYVAHPLQEEDAAGVASYLKGAIIAGLACKLSTPLTSDEALQLKVKQEYLGDGGKDPGALTRAKQADARRAEDPGLAGERGYSYYDELR